MNVKPTCIISVDIQYISSIPVLDIVQITIKSTTPVTIWIILDPTLTPRDLHSPPPSDTSTATTPSPPLQSLNPLVAALRICNYCITRHVSWGMMSILIVGGGLLVLLTALKAASFCYRKTSNGWVLHFVLPFYSHEVCTHSLTKDFTHLLFYLRCSASLGLQLWQRATCRTVRYTHVWNMKVGTCNMKGTSSFFSVGSV